MYHIANIFIGNSLTKQSRAIAKLVHGSGTASHEHFDNYCRFIKINKTDERIDVNNYKLSKQSKLFDELSLEENCDSFYTEDELNEFLKSLHTDMVTANTVIGLAELKLFVYINLCDKESCELATVIAQVAKSIRNQKFNVVFIGYDADLVHATIEQEGSLREKSKMADSDKKLLADFEKEEKFSGIKSRFLLFQNTTNTGASLNLDNKTLNTIVAELILMSLENYDNLFPNTIDSGQITGLGLSNILFDKKYFVRYLMRKAYISVLQNEGIEQKKVSRPEIEPIIQNILQPKIRLLSNFYEKEVKPLLLQKENQEDIVAAIVPKLDEHFRQFEEDMLSFLSNDSEIIKGDGTPLTIPEKRAALALMLNIDDELLEGTSFQSNILSIDDTYNEAATIFIDANNGLPGTTGGENPVIIPRPITRPIDENNDAIFPLKKVKSLKQEILTTTENIRKWEEQLQSTEEIKQSEEQSKRRLTQNGFVFGDTEYRLLGKTPLETLAEVYEPGNIEIKNSIDLRPSFTEAKNQGNLGSCTTFSITSIYEYLLKKSKGELFDLSERFVYYNTNVKDGRTQGGASFKDVIESMKTFGICNEDDCPYIIEEIEEEPTPEAYNKALSHKILEAKRVEVNHKDITSALSQGYPVAVCMRVYNSFGTGYQGFEMLPSQEEIDKNEYEYHAMVICGYSEDEHIYIVRNSWGKEFGDNGYCYIPFSYIEDPAFQTTCCIITRTLDGEIKGLPTTKTTVNFITQDTKILSILLQIKLEEAKKELQSLQNEYNTQMGLFIQSIQTLETTRTRNNITEMTLEQLSGEISNLKSKRAELKGKFTSNLDGIRKLTNNSIRISLFTALLFLLLTILSWWYGFDAVYKITFGIISVLGALCTVLIFLDKKHRIARKRKALNDELGQLSQRIANLENEKKVLKLKHYLAGMIIDRISDLKRNLIKKYNNVVSYTKNISTWYKEEKGLYEKMDCNLHIPLVGLLDNNTLDAYFNKHSSDIVSNIRFSDYMNEYEMGDEQIIAFKDRLRETIINRLLNVAQDFDIIRCITSPTTYPFIDGSRFNSKTLIPQMDRLSVPLIQYQSLSGNISPSKYLFHHNNGNTHNFQSHFSSTPSSVSMESEDKLVTIQTVELELESVIPE